MVKKGLDIKVKDVMTRDPECCSPEDTLSMAAERMRDNDCGAIPVVDGRDRMALGVITDRDIVVRAIAEGLDPDETSVERCMSTDLVTVEEDATLNEVRKAMEERKVRRVLVVDAQGGVIGLVPLAKIARLVSEEEVGEVLGAISEA